jgi:hypothetical protein
MSEPKLEDCDRSQELELEGSIDDCKHSELVGKSGDLPTPPYRAPLRGGDLQAGDYVVRFHSSTKAKDLLSSNRQ